MRLLTTVLIALASVAALSQVPATAQGALTCGQKYAVAPGDSISKIARRVYGTNRAPELYAANRAVIGANHDLLLVGTVLTLPCLDAEQDVRESTARKLTQPKVAQATDRDAAASTKGQGGTFSRAAGFTSKTLAAAPAQIVEIVFNKASALEFILNTGIVDPLFADISRATNGRVRFVEPAEHNRDPRAQMNLVRNGKADGAYIFNGYLAEQNPLLQITMAPMVGGTAQQTATALWRTHQRYFADAGRFDGLKLLGFVGAPPAHIWRVSDAPVTGSEQLLGNSAMSLPGKPGPNQSAVKIRADVSDPVRSQGSAAAQPPATVALNHAAARTMGIWKNAKSVTEIDGGVYAPTFSVFIRAEKWEQIAPADRETIEALLGESLAQRSAAWDAFDNTQKRAMLKQGLKVEKADLDLLIELQDRARLAWETWIAKADNAGVPGYEALEAFFAEIEALRLQTPSVNGVQS